MQRGATAAADGGEQGDVATEEGDGVHLSQQAASKDGSMSWFPKLPWDKQASGDALSKHETKDYPIQTDAAYSPRSPRAKAASHIVEAAARSAVDAMVDLDATATSSPLKPIPSIGPLPPPPTLLLPNRPPPLDLERLESRASSVVELQMDEQYLGDIPEQAQIRNLDTGEVISYEQADLLHGSLTTLTPHRAASSSNSTHQTISTARRWTWGMLTPRFSKDHARGSKSAKSLVSPRKGVNMTPRAPSTPRQQTALTKAVSVASELAQKATRHDHPGSEFEAITYYRQAVRMILVALDLYARVDPGKDSGVDARALHHYAKLYKARASKLEQVLEEELPREAFENPRSWFAAQASALQAELDDLDALDAEDARREEEARALQEAALEEEALAAQEAELDAELLELEEAALAAQDAALRAEEIELERLDAELALKSEHAVAAKDNAALTTAKPSRQLVPALAIPCGANQINASSSSSSSINTCRSATAASALMSARSARSSGSLTARSMLKPELESVGMLTPRSGKDTDERTERLQDSSTAAREAPPSARRSTARSKQDKQAELVATMPDLFAIEAPEFEGEEELRDKDDWNLGISARGTPPSSAGGHTSPPPATVSRMSVVPMLAIPGGDISKISGRSSGMTSVSNGVAASALMSARSARSSGSLTARSGLKPELESVGMLTPRSGKDTDERTERLQGSSTTAREAPPSARRPRMIADSASQRVELPIARTGLTTAQAAGRARVPVPSLCIPSADGTATTQSGMATCITGGRGVAASALMSARSARSSGSLTARSGLKPELESVGMLTPRSGKDTDERTERLQGSSTTAREAPPSARRIAIRKTPMLSTGTGSAQVAVQEPELDLEPELEPEPALERQVL